MASEFEIDLPAQDKFPDPDRWATPSPVIVASIQEQFPGLTDYQARVFAGGIEQKIADGISAGALPALVHGYGDEESAYVEVISLEVDLGQMLRRKPEVFE